MDSYAEGLRLFSVFLAEKGMPLVVSNLRREHVEAFIAELLAIRSSERGADSARTGEAKCAFHCAFLWLLRSTSEGLMPAPRTGHGAAFRREVGGCQGA